VAARLPFRSFYAKLAAVLLALLVASSGVHLWLTLRGARLHADEVHHRLDREVAAHIAEVVRPFSGAEVDRKALKGLFTDVMVVNPSLEVYLLDLEGALLAYDAPEEHILRRRVDLAPIERFLAASDEGAIHGDDPRSADGTKPISVAPVIVDGSPMGYLYIILGGEKYESVATMLGRSAILQLGFWLAAASLVVVTVTGLFAFRVLTRPLRALEQRMASFRETGEGGPETVPGEDEIQRLARTYEQMSERIAEQVRSLETNDERRREMLASISHDLRTPTAAVQGYLETLLLREERVDVDERRRFLEAALRQCAHLTRLVDQLFELARLEAREVEPALEPFSLAELAQDVAHKFREPAKRAGVELHVELDHDLPEVVADIGLIERVLDNLIDNAVRFTDAGGEVTLEIRSVDGRVGFRVRDTGRGIPEQELPRVFDRFYRVDKSRGSDPGGTGLGLAITKRILDLHASAICVKSKVDEGTSFSFALGAVNPS
jgi:signal transduction histidine kinase